MAGQITLLRLQRAWTMSTYSQGAATLYPGLCSSALTARAGQCIFCEQVVRVNQEQSHFGYIKLDTLTVSLAPNRLQSARNPVRVTFPPNENTINHRNVLFKSWKNVILIPLSTWKSVRKQKYSHWKSVFCLLFCLYLSKTLYLCTYKYK